MKKKKILFASSIAGTLPNPSNPKRPTEFSYKPGQTALVDAHLADAWVASGIADYAPDDPSALEAQIAQLQEQLAEAKKPAKK